MSGKPLRGHATAMLRRVVDLTGGRFPIIAAGGVMSAEERSKSWTPARPSSRSTPASIYRGPGLVKSILEHAALPARAAR